MSGLPDYFRSLDGTATFQRVPKDDALISKLAESGFDKLFGRDLDVIERLLRDAELIGEHSSLKRLADQHHGGQVLGIDVLLAEVGEDGSFQRFVIVEDKLQKNPKRREVLAQIFEYAQSLLGENPRSALLERLTREHSEWLHQNLPFIEESLDVGNLLLIMTGDRFDRQLVRLVEHYTKSLSPTNLMQLGLVSLAVYRGGGTEFAVPTVVRTVERSLRDLTLRITITDEAGNRLRHRVTEASEVQVNKPARIRWGAWTEEEFFNSLRTWREEVAYPVVRAVFDWANERGLTLHWGSGQKLGNFYVHLPGLAASFVSAYTDGKLWFDFGGLGRNLPEYSDDDALAALAERISTIAGRPIIPGRLTSYTGLPAALFAAPKKLSALLDLLSELHGPDSPE